MGARFIRRDGSSTPWSTFFVRSAPSAARLFLPGCSPDTETGRGAPADELTLVGPPPMAERAGFIDFQCSMFDVECSMFAASRGGDPLSPCSHPRWKLTCAKPLSSSMKSLNDLKIQIYADGADKAGILDLYAKPYIKGLTTNPSLMKK